MRNLINGILDFRRRFLPGLKDVFTKLDDGQHPDCLFVACSDSRVVPNLFASTNPGEMFVVRNVGNLIPPSNKSSFNYTNKYLDSAGAALEFSTMALGVRNIVVCGHSKCGAVTKFHQCNGNTSQMYETTPHIANWLHNIKYSLEKLKKYKEGGCKEPMVFKGLSAEGNVLMHVDENLSEADQLSQVNVLQQLEHVMTYGVVSERLLKRELIVHGWWFNIKSAEVWAFSDRKQRFLLLDEERAQSLLERIAEVEMADDDHHVVKTNPPPWIDGIRRKKLHQKHNQDIMVDHHHDHHHHGHHHGHHGSHGHHGHHRHHHHHHSETKHSSHQDKNRNEKLD